MSRIVIGALLAFAAGIGFAITAVYANLDGRVLLHSGVEVAADRSLTRYRAGTNVYFRTLQGQTRSCNVAERAPIDRIVYDPADPRRCRVPTAVGAWSEREITWLFFAALLALGGVVPLGVHAVLRATEDPLDRLL